MLGGKVLILFRQNRTKKLGIVWMLPENRPPFILSSHGRIHETCTDLTDDSVLQMLLLKGRQGGQTPCSDGNSHHRRRSLPPHRLWARQTAEGMLCALQVARSFQPATTIGGGVYRF